MSVARYIDKSMSVRPEGQNYIKYMKLATVLHVRRQIISQMIH